MSVKRILIFLSFVVMVGLMLQQCWQSKSQGEKWLYFFGDPARDYAGLVLGPGRGTAVPIPPELSETTIEVHDSYVVFSPAKDSNLVLAFSPAGAPEADSDQRPWTPIGDGWYVLGTQGPNAQ